MPLPVLGFMPAHPRIRGEHAHLTIYETTIDGSSPHTRGAPGEPLSPALDGRLIPAYAGSTQCVYWKFYTPPAHPRIRGEHAPPSISTNIDPGSSPHTRGARVPSRLEIQQGRLIPAYAGSTRKWSGLITLTAAHPRIRGEHVSTLRTPILMRRLIPAYAGSTSSTSPACTPLSAHPRIRGEHACQRRRLGR